jgi:hypothetical protein
MASPASAGEPIRLQPPPRPGAQLPGSEDCTARAIPARFRTVLFDLVASATAR